VSEAEPTKLALVMVGLPARGKTYVTTKIARYLAWLGFSTRTFNVGDYRRKHGKAKVPAEFFAPDNAGAVAQRNEFALEALNDLLTWLREGGQVAIYDATNHERRRREAVYERCASEGVQVIFVESVCEDESVVEANVRDTKLRSPDYAGMDPERAVADFRARIAHYERSYEPLDEHDEHHEFVKLVDVGRKVVVNRMEGWLAARLVFFLMNIHPARRRIWLTRHGESQFNVLGRIGGDSWLSPRGAEYAKALGRFLPSRLGAGEVPEVWTSTLRRTLATAQPVPFRARAFRALDEIDAGICDGMTYEEIGEQMPEEFAARAEDKLRYRYPRGESYADVIQRLEPVIVELERQRAPVLVIAHQAVLRALYVYLTGRPQAECPHASIPLHTVIELQPTAYGYEETRFEL
jgi:broad specificity phosphatase PhoE/predicted kinase